MSKESIFLINELKKEFPVPLLAFEYFGSLLHLATDNSEEYVIQCAILTLIKCCGLDEPEDSDITYFIKRIASALDKEGPSKAKPNIRRKTFMSSYIDTLGNTSVDVLLMDMCNYDYSKARVLYCELDRDIAMRLLGNHLQFLVETAKLHYECSLYGQGGKYSDDDSDSVVYDLSSGEGLDELTGLF